MAHNNYSMIKIISDEEQLLRIQSECKRDDSINQDSKSEFGKIVSRFGITSNNNKIDSSLNRSNVASKEEIKEGGVVHRVSSLFKKKDKYNYIP
jgi:hypothetical protein